MALTKIQDEMLALSGTGIKAYVYFTGVGTVTILDSYNVSSITDNGTGTYTINFTNALSTSDFGVVAGTYAFAIRDMSTRTTSSVLINTYDSANGLTDYNDNTVVIYET